MINSSTTYGGTQQTASGIFPYAYFFYGDDGYDIPAASIGTDNPCRSVTLQFLPADDDADSTAGAVETAEIVQQAQDPVAQTVPYDMIGSISANLTPGQSWGIKLAVQPQTNAVFNTFINGSAVCDTLSLTTS